MRHPSSHIYVPQTRMMILSFAAYLIQWNLNITKLPRDWQNVFAITRFRYIKVLFHMFYYYWGEENVCYTKDFRIQRFVISRFHCDNFFSFLFKFSGAACEDSAK